VCETTNEPGSSCWESTVSPEPVFAKVDLRSVIVPAFAGADEKLNAASSAKAADKNKRFIKIPSGRTANTLTDNLAKACSNTRQIPMIPQGT
jgi:hypothetical protein